jgi:hypothetical protein
MSNQNVYVYSSDPGLEVLLGKGSVLNAVLALRSSRRYADGLTTWGIVGAVTNDQGVPGEPVVLENGISDLMNDWGPFDTDLGEGAASGYEGNLAALCDGLDAARICLVPVDLAIKTATVATGEDLEVTLTRTLDITGDEATDVITAEVEHGLDIGAEVVLASLAGGEGISAGTFYVLTVPTATTLTLSSTLGGALAAFTTAITAGTLAPTEARTLPAGKQIRRGAAALAITGAEATEVVTTATPHGLVVGETVSISGLTGDAGAVAGDYVVATAPSATTLTLTGFAFTTDITVGTLTRAAGYTLATLEPVVWASGAAGSKTVRMRQVSGSPIRLDLVTELVTGADGVAVATTITTVPDEIDAAELVLRYEAALDAINNDTLGADIDVICTDRNEAAINDLLAVHVAESEAAGIFRVGVIAPPVGTSLADARGSGSNGNTRVSLNRNYVIDVHPGVRKRFPKGADDLVGPDYVATFPAQCLVAAIVCSARPEQNPAEDALVMPVMQAYGVVGIEKPQGSGGSDHWAAGLVTPKLEQGAGVLLRDGLMASGVEIATKRTQQFIIGGLISRLRPYQKTVATVSNREGAVDVSRAWLSSLRRDGRIAEFAISGTWVSADRHLIVEVAVQEIGTMNVITIKLSVGADEIAAAAGLPLAA